MADARPSGWVPLGRDSDSWWYVAASNACERNAARHSASAWPPAASHTFHPRVTAPRSAAGCPRCTHSLLKAHVPSVRTGRCPWHGTVGLLLHGVVGVARHEDPPGLRIGCAPATSLSTPCFIAGVRRRWRRLFLGPCVVRRSAFPRFNTLMRRSGPCTLPPKATVADGAGALPLWRSP